MQYAVNQSRWFMTSEKNLSPDQVPGSGSIGFSTFQELNGGWSGEMTIYQGHHLIKVGLPTTFQSIKNKQASMIKNYI